MSIYGVQRSPIPLLSALVGLGPGVEGPYRIFTYIYHQNQPFMQVNIQSSHGSVMGLLLGTFVTLNHHQ